MICLNQDEMKKIDKLSCDIYTSIKLMYLAGSNMADIIIKNYNVKNVLAVVGKGGNAGDAIVILNKLHDNGIKTTIYKAFNDITNNDALYYLNEYMGVFIDNLDNINEYDLIIDGIFGIGLNKELDKNIIDIIDTINNSNKTVISLDIPSGIDSTTGINYGAYIKSDLCITVEYLKTGMLLNDGLNSYKKYEIINVGMISPTNFYNVLTINDFKGFYKERLRNTNKGSFGRATIIAGSINYPGASLISYSALLSFKMGVGYTSLYVPKSLYNLYALKHPELIINKMEENDGFIKYNEEELDKIMSKSDSITIGMGMGVSIDLYNTLKYLIKNYDKYLIIDADAINSISKYGIDILNDAKAKIILTPHLKEFERLTNIKINDIVKDQITIAKEFAKKYNLILMLKSSSTIITNGIKAYINISGNSSLAKAGSGDALAGILSGVSAYFDIAPLMMSAFSSFMLGDIADMALNDLETESATITEIIKYIPNFISKIKSL